VADSESWRYVEAPGTRARAGDDRQPARGSAIPPRSERVAAKKVASCSWSLTCVFNRPLYTEPLLTLSQDATLPFGHMPHSASIPPPLLAHVHMPMNQRMFWIEAKSGETKRGCRRVNTREQVLRIWAGYCGTGKIQTRRRSTISRRIECE
jgi:hypothetical protein